MQLLESIHCSAWPQWAVATLFASTSGLPHKIILEAHNMRLLSPLLTSAFAAFRCSVDRHVRNEAGGVRGRATGLGLEVPEVADNCGEAARCSRACISGVSATQQASEQQAEQAAGWARSAHHWMCTRSRIAPECRCYSAVQTTGSTVERNRSCSSRSSTAESAMTRWRLCTDSGSSVG